MARPKTGGLGRGLNSLFEDSGFNPEPVSVEEAKETKTEKAVKKTSGEEVVYIRLSDIKPNSKQPRKEFSEEALEDLANSIREYGVIQPILVRPSGKGYELVAGERRWRAAHKAELKQIPAIVRELDDRQNAFYALIENMQREDLNSVEEAEGIRKIMDDYGLNQEDAAKVIGKSRPYVANSLRLLRLPEEVRQLVVEKKLSAGHARAIAGLPDEDLQIEAAKKAVENGWSVRQIEGYTGSKTSRKKTEKKSKIKDPQIRAVEEKLCQDLGTKVFINGTEKKGKLELAYYSRAELERLLEILGQN